MHKIATLLLLRAWEWLNHAQNALTSGIFIVAVADFTVACVIARNAWDHRRCHRDEEVDWVFGNDLRNRH